MNLLVLMLLHTVKYTFVRLSRPHVKDHLRVYFYHLGVFISLLALLNVDGKRNKVYNTILYMNAFCSEQVFLCMFVFSPPPRHTVCCTFSIFEEIHLFFFFFVTIVSIEGTMRVLIPPVVVGAVLTLLVCVLQFDKY